MNDSVVASDSRKRKRQPDEDMAEETSYKQSRWFQEAKAMATRFVEIWTPRKTNQRNDDRSSDLARTGQGRPRLNTPGIPGAFPDQSGPLSVKETLRPMHGQSITAKGLNGQDRNNATYWRSIGKDITANDDVASRLDPRLSNLPLPAPYPKPKPRTSRPMFRRRPVLFPRGRILGRSEKPSDFTPPPSILRKGAHGAIVKSDELTEDVEAQVQQILIDREFEGLGDLTEQFRRSQKLSAKEDKLQRREPSPRLLVRLDEAAEDYKRLITEERERKLRPKTPDKPKLLVSPLPTETLNSLPNLTKIAAHQQLGMFGRTPVTARDLLTLRPGVWLNDEVINSWLWELCDKAKIALAKDMEKKDTPIKDDTPRYHAFNTQWYPTMESSDWRNKVPRWAKRAKVDGANLLKVHKILIPIHQGAHWTLIVIMPQRRVVRYYNSMPGSATPYLQAAKDWISHELGDKWNESEWQIQQADSGQQVNMSDCGVFASLNALASFYSDALPEILPTGELTDGRNFMKFILINGGFKDDFELIKLHPDFRLEEDKKVNGEVPKIDKGKEKAK